MPYLDSDLVFDYLHRCTKCLLPDTFPRIELDENGVCNYCKDQPPYMEKGEQAFIELLNKYRDVGKDYDCIAPISGGRDSAYVLHQMVKKYNMRVQTLTVDSGFITTEAYRNIETITDNLGVDHVWLRDEKQIAQARRNTVIKFRGWVKNPSIHNIVPVLNSGDKMMNLQMFKYASENNIPLLLGGNIVGTSTFEHGNSRTGYLGVFPDDHGVYSLTDKLKLILYYGWDFASNTYNWHQSIFTEYIKGAFIYFFDSLLKPKNVELVGFYDYVPWIEEKIVSTISKIGWQGAEDTSTTWRIDDSAYALINYVYFYLAGIDEHVELYSKMIRAGQITRKEAYTRCKSDSRPRIPSLETGWSELGVTEQLVHTALDRYREKMIKNYLKGTSFERCMYSSLPSTSHLTLEAPLLEPTTSHVD
ncbi:MAG: hypothetical protein NWE89_04840 [Candidatus Bathyarchaeota archaeon]|nr:hypothetical protein [Candidatus Bathyarchaeota archaeon]